MNDDKNEVHIVGCLGRDPDVKFTGNGTAYCHLSVATTYRPEGKPAVTEWHRVTGWREIAERMGNLRKGSRISLHGRLHYSSYEKEGRKMYATEIVAYEFAIDGEQKAAKAEDDPGVDEDGEKLPF